MKLYHGSNVAVQKPQILTSDRKLDFGTGFYLTSSLEQAERWAELTTERRKTGTPTISVYEFDETKLDELKILKFEKANKKWLDFVVANRDNTIDGDTVVYCKSIYSHRNFASFIAPKIARSIYVQDTNRLAVFEISGGC